MNNNRRYIIEQLTIIFDNVCKQCENRRNERYCIKKCKYGQQLRVLGDQLDTNKKRLTEESYQKYKNKGYRDKEIADIFQVSDSTLSKRKQKWTKP